jgi:hypothetical protein
VKSADDRKTPHRLAILRRAVLVPVLRLGFFLGVACVVAIVLLLQSVRADVEDVLSGAGATILEYPGAPREGLRKLHLNGVRVSFRTQTIEAPLVDVLAHYETLCRTRGAGLADQLRTIATQTGGSDRAGYVACLDMGDAPQSLGTLVSRFVSFSETGDLRELGALRYALARRITGNSRESTFLLTMWADSAVHLHRMLPHGGADAAGHDPVGVPRPLGSQRILSVWEDQQPSGIFVYRVTAKSAEELDAFYRSELPKHGWMVIERHPSESIEVDGIRMLSSEKDGRLVTVLSRSGGASPTVLTFLASEPTGTYR